MKLISSVPHFTFLVWVLENYKLHIRLTFVAHIIFLSYSTYPCFGEEEIKPKKVLKIYSKSQKYYT